MISIMVSENGYQNGIAGGEFFFPLAHHDKLDGNYPMFGKVISGLEEIVRIGSLPVRDFNVHPNPSYPMHTTISDEIIDTIRVDTHGITYPEPKKLENAQLPNQWTIEHFQEQI